MSEKNIRNQILKVTNKIIAIMFFLFLISCSSQRVISKEINFSIKDEQNKIAEVKLTNGKFYNFSIDKRYSYILKENTIEIFKLGVSEIEIEINQIESYTVEKINEFSGRNFIIGALSAIPIISSLVFLIARLRR